jgi:hypothetical protein
MAGGRTAVYFFKLFICGGPEMAPALPPVGGHPLGGPEMATALPQLAGVSALGLVC